jgi:Flp pilus assembly protein TadG
MVCYSGRAASRDDLKEAKDNDEAAAAAAAFAAASGGLNTATARSIAEHHQRLFGELTAGTANLMAATTEEDMSYKMR